MVINHTHTHASPSQANGIAGSDAVDIGVRDVLVTGLAGGEGLVGLHPLG